MKPVFAYDDDDDDDDEENENKNINSLDIIKKESRVFFLKKLFLSFLKL